MVSSGSALSVDVVVVLVVAAVVEDSDNAAGVVGVVERSDLPLVRPEDEEGVECVSIMELVVVVDSEGVLDVVLSACSCITAVFDVEVLAEEGGGVAGTEGEVPAPNNPHVLPSSARTRSSGQKQMNSCLV